MAESPPISIRKRFLYAVASIYAPPLTLALVAQIALTCAHCRETSLKMWPIFPSLSALQLLPLRGLLPNWGVFTLAAAVPLLAVAAMVITSKNSRTTLLSETIAATILSTVFSLLTLAMIRA